MSSADPRTDQQIRDDYLADRLIELSASVKALTAIVAEAHQQPTHVQKVIHKTEGMGTVGILCAAVCALVLIFVVVEFDRQNANQSRIAKELTDKIRDLDAWRGVQGNDIASLKAQVRQLDQPKRTTQ